LRSPKPHPLGTIGGWEREAENGEQNREQRGTVGTAETINEEEKRKKEENRQKKHIKQKHHRKHH
jgi:hypothetical protein